MEHSQSREQVVEKLMESMEPLLNHYHLDEIGVYQEEGPNDEYYAGYTVKKGDKVFMVHQPYSKNSEGQMSLKDDKWIVQSDDGGMERRELSSLQDVLTTLH